MSLPLILEGDALVIGWLNAHEDIAAFEANVSGKRPASFVRPWIRVTQLDVRRIPRSRTERHLDYTIQMDCYAGLTATKAEEGQGEASALAVTARAVLDSLDGTTTDEAVISRIDFAGPFHAGADTDLDPARERYILTAEILMRPA